MSFTKRTSNLHAIFVLWSFLPSFSVIPWVPISSPDVFPQLLRVPISCIFLPSLVSPFFFIFNFFLSFNEF